MHAFVLIIFLKGNPLIIRGNPSLWNEATWSVFDAAVARGGHPELHSVVNGKIVISHLDLI